MKKIRNTLLVLGILCLGLSLITPPFAGAAAKHKPMKAYILTPKLGSSGYVMASALIKFSQGHPWLKLSMVPGYFSAKAIIEGSSRDPKNLMMLGSESATQQALVGAKPFKKKYPNVRMISHGVDIYLLRMSYSNIRKWEDYDGKKISETPRYIIASYQQTIDTLTRLGIRDNVKVVQMSSKEQADSFMDGLTSSSGFAVIKTKKGYVPHQSYTEIWAMKKDKLYFQPRPWVDMRSAIKKVPGMVLMPVTVPAGSLNKNQTEDLESTLYDMVGLVAFAGADADMVYEVIKMLHKHLDELPNFSAFLAGMDEKKLVGSVMKVYPDTWQKMIHPGALRYYKEAGLIK